MNFSQAILLAIIQGLTEFLPISSSGHLVFFQKLMGLETPPIFFDILVHLATLLAIVFYFRKSIFRFFKVPQNIFLVFIASLPAAFFGLLLNSQIETVFNSFRLLSFSWFLNAFLLLSTKFIKKESLKKIAVLKWADALFIGAFQAAALFPGVSRSGSTIVAGLWRRLTRESALQISFFLAIPAIFGAMLLSFVNWQPHQLPRLTVCLVGFFVAVLSGFVGLFLLEKVLKKRKLAYFSLYCFGLGAASLVFSFIFH